MVSAKRRNNQLQGKVRSEEERIQNEEQMCFQFPLILRFSKFSQKLTCSANFKLVLIDTNSHSHGGLSLKDGSKMVPNSNNIIMLAILEEVYHRRHDGIL